jgi:epoxyqueuosine reductase
VRRSEPPAVTDQGYLDALRALLAEHGITHVGVASAEVLSRARTELFERRDAGLHDGMAFTYKNPERSTDPQAAVRDARTVLVAARPYLLGDPPPTAPHHARVARYAWVDHYAPLRTGLRAAADRLRRDGHRAVAFADDNSMVDREIAHRAGLGWFGKNANLLISGAGSWFVLGSVVTTAELPLSEGPVADGCGTCVRCIDGCPTGAIVRPGVIDAARCLAWLLQKPGIIDPRFRGAIGDRIYGCDDCQEVCPPTVRLGVRHRTSSDDEIRAEVDVFALLGGSDEEVLATWGRWYLADRDPRWLRRNALVVLGNTGDREDVRVVAVIARYLADRDPILRAHAVWAARRLSLDHLLPASDPDPDVAAELTRPAGA